MIGDEISARTSPLADIVARGAARSYDVYYILPRLVLRAATRGCSTPGAACSARTSSSSTTWTRSARPSRSPSASPRTPSTSTRASTDLARSRLRTRRRRSLRAALADTSADRTGARRRARPRRPCALILAVGRLGYEPQAHDRRRSRLRRRRQGHGRGLALRRGPRASPRRGQVQRRCARPRTTSSPTTGGTTRSPSSARAPFSTGCGPTCPGSCSSTRSRSSRRPTTSARSASPAHSTGSPSTGTRCSPLPTTGRPTGPGSVARGTGPAWTPAAWASARPPPTRWPTRRRAPGGDGRPGRCAAGSRLLRDRLTDELGPLDVPGIDDCMAAFDAFSDRVRIVGGEYLTGLLHPDRSSSRARRASCSTSGTASIRTRPGPRPRSPTPRRCSPKRACPARLCGSAWSGPTPSGTARARSSPRTRCSPPPLPESAQRPGRWQGPVRVGHLDMVALRYATEVCAAQGHPVDAAAVSCLDVAARTPRSADLPQLRRDRATHPWDGRGSGPAGVDDGPADGGRSGAGGVRR